MAKWECEICGNEFDNFHAQGFDSKIYCPLCFFKEKTNRLEKENTQLKENNMSMQEEMARTWEKADLYKDVIEEVKDRITIKLRRYINEKDYVIDDVALDELLQILDILKKEDN